jgi:hypothetical protein
MVAPYSGILPGLESSWKTAPLQRAVRLRMPNAYMARSGKRGVTKLKIRVTARGRRLLARSKKLTLVAKAVFIPVGAAATRSHKRLTLSGR